MPLDLIAELALIEASRQQREAWEQERMDLDAIDAVWYGTDAQPQETDQ